MDRSQVESSEAKRAYYIEYPDLEMAVMLRFDGDAEPTIRTADFLEPATMVAVLMTDGYETFAYTSILHKAEDREWPYRHWERIDPADLPEVTLAVEGPDGIMWGKRHQLRQGRVVCASEDREKGESFWHVDGAEPLEQCVEPVPAPPYFKG